MKLTRKEINDFRKLAKLKPFIKENIQLIAEQDQYTKEDLVDIQNEIKQRQASIEKLKESFPKHKQDMLDGLQFFSNRVKEMAGQVEENSLIDLQELEASLEENMNTLAFRYNNVLNSIKDHQDNIEELQSDMEWIKSRLSRNS